MQMKDLESGKEHVANILQQHDFRLCCTGTNVVSSSCNIISFTSCISMILNMFGWTMIAIFIALSRSTKISVRDVMFISLCLCPCPYSLPLPCQ